MPQHHRLIAAFTAACALALAVVAHPVPAAAVATLLAQQSTDEQVVTIDLTQPSSAVLPSGTLRADVGVAITVPAEYLEVRLRLISPTGRLVYQKTEVRAELSEGRHIIGFEYDLMPLDLPPGRYPIEVRVLATGSEPTTFADRLLILPADVGPLPVALVVRVSDPPAVAADGRFTRDPATETRLRDDVAFVSQLALGRRVPLALSIAPVLLEQLARAADGYETTDGTSVGADSEVAARYAATLADLRSAAASGTLDLVDVPYALPDPSGLEAADARDDLAAHWERSDAVIAAVLGTQEARAAAYIGNYPTIAALDALAARGTAPALVIPDTLYTEDGTVTPGGYTMDDSDARLVAVDADAASAASLGQSVFYDVLFERLGATEAVVIVLDLGPDGPNAAIEAQRVLDWIAAASWLAPTDLTSAVSPTVGTASLGRRPESAAPAGYWASIAEARSSALAYATAVGAADADADAMRRAVLAAESALWAGSDGQWGMALQGLDIADAVAEFVAGQFALVSVDARDVTLSGSRGEVPLQLVNGTGKPLALTIVASSDHIGLPRAELPVTVEPDENFVTVPVDLGRILSGDLHVTVRAGGVNVAETTVRVKASHLDRLATVGMVVIVLLGLLVFIRRRVRAAIAGTIAEDGDEDLLTPPAGVSEERCGP